VVKGPSTSLRTGLSPRIVALVALVACGSTPPKPPPPYTQYGGGSADLSRAVDADMIAIEAGPYVSGSAREERERAYDAYRETAGRDTARAQRWFAREREPHQQTLPSFVIDRTPVTNAAYAEFVADTGIAQPVIDEAAWRAQGFSQDYATEVARFNWRGGTPPEERGDHPVVLVTWRDAAAYCAWRGEVVGAARRLPTADEYEKAARGISGAAYPWGVEYDASMLNSAVAGPRDTTPVGSCEAGASPYGMLDAAGNVFQWTSTPWEHKPNAMTVKGSAWDDYAGVGRAASAYGRPRSVRHAIVGFRCAGD
jgi:formylglycine-generating enzyme required for sulfatase activity